MAKQIKTSCSVFANRGDPWITEREQGRGDNAKQPALVRSSKELPLLARKTTSGVWGDIFAKQKVSLNKKKPDAFFPDPDENPEIDQHLYAGRVSPGKLKTASLIGDSQARTARKPQSITERTLRKIAAINRSKA